jgi:hypothetical protein
MNHKSFYLLLIVTIGFTVLASPPIDADLRVIGDGRTVVCS